ncbi:hypothetical protein ACNTMW_31000 [Planosporangium sp. 12N6]|uniref:hypothetical protein n=1 Tax=Planosporangium spinosum TaxID=3402278 RepID=UPI003CFADD16
MTTRSTTTTAALRRLRHVLGVIVATDPSRDGHTGPDSPEITIRYARHNTLIWTALALAHQAGSPAGVGYDPTDPVRPVVAYLELSTGQVSWHLPIHDFGWDGHTTNDKYWCIDTFLGYCIPFRSDAVLGRSRSM